MKRVSLYEVCIEGVLHWIRIWYVGFDVDKVDIRIVDGGVYVKWKDVTGEGWVEDKIKALTNE